MGTRRMPAGYRAMGWHLLLFSLAAPAVGCGGTASDAGGGGGDTPDAAMPAQPNPSGTSTPMEAGPLPDHTAPSSTSGSPSTLCAVDADCTAQLPPTQPPNCATAHCNAQQGTCSFTAKDADGDGHLAAVCASTNGVPIQTGDDCDDSDPKLYPGRSESCSETADGGTITWPEGMPAGQCAYGQISCGANGVKSGCVGAQGPAPRDCTSMNDNDCDGVPDSSECTCTPGATQACYSGAAGTKGLGNCKGGTQTCAAADGGAAWGPCVGEVLPKPKDCSSLADNDCSGKPDDTECGACTTGTTETCYTGPASTAGKGICKSGSQTCTLTDGGMTQWSACVGSVGPGMRNCASMADNDCDGLPDAPECGPCETGATQSCYPGPEGTENVGVCASGTQTCVQSGETTSWSDCTGYALPGTFSCGSSDDNDCNGTADDQESVCACTGGYEPGQTASCDGDVSCSAGTMLCESIGTSSVWGPCTGAVYPQIDRIYPAAIQFTDKNAQNSVVGTINAPPVGPGQTNYEVNWDMTQADNVDNTHYSNDPKGPAGRVECADGSTHVDLGSADFTNGSNSILCPAGVATVFYKMTNWGGSCCGGYTRTYTNIVVSYRGC